MTPLMSSALLRAQTDDRLVRMAADGHDRAFEAIVERYRRPLLRYLRRLLSDTLAEDVVQATFLNAWSSLRAGTDVRELRPWLYRIAHNAAINALKKVGEAMEEIPESVGGFATEPAAEFERRDEMHRALHSIAALPSRQRTALLAIAVDGRAHSDVAAELGLTDGAVRQLVHRARATLRTGATAMTPMPLLHALVTSAGDSTVSRVAEVAAGAGGAGAASVSLKAGAAAVLATGALVTGGPRIAHVVHPSQQGTAVTEAQRPASPPSRVASTAAATAAAPSAAAGSTPAATAASASAQRERHRERTRASAGSASRRSIVSGGPASGGTPTPTVDSGHQGGTGDATAGRAPAAVPAVQPASHETEPGRQSGRTQDSSGGRGGSGGRASDDTPGETSGSGKGDDSGRHGGDDDVATTPAATTPATTPSGTDDHVDSTPTQPQSTTPPSAGTPTTTTPADDHGGGSSGEGRGGGANSGPPGGG